MWINPQVQEIIHSTPPWPGFSFKVVDADEGILLLLSVEELSKYSQRQQDDIVAWMIGMLNQIRRMKVPCYIREWKPNAL